MSSPYGPDGGRPRRRGVFTHWVPLVLTLTIATAGVAAWAWSQRNRDDEEEEEEGGYRPGQQQRPYTDLDYEHADYGDNPPYGASSSGPSSRPPGPGVTGGGGRDASSTVGNQINMTETASAAGASGTGGGWSSRMSGALGGASSPAQQWVGSASKAVSAGITAASAAVGGALASIREGDKDAYADHETWSEEADSRRDNNRTSTTGAPAGAAPSAASRDSAGRKRKTVAIVVSAEHYADGADEEGFHEHASILSYIPRQNDFSKTRIFVLIYAPGLKDKETTPATLAASATLDASQPTPNSLSSSFSNIGADPQSPKQDANKSSSQKDGPGDVYYTALHAQARALVEKETEIIPFTSPSGHAHILHLLEPDVVYLQESLTGDNGAVVNQLQNWMRNDVVVVVGAESGYGGLADSESEAEKPGGASGSEGTAGAQKWWQREDRVGRGRGVVVVDGLRVHDDWVRRVQGRD